MDGCGQGEAGLERPPHRYAIHDAAEADDVAALAALLAAENSDEYRPGGADVVILDKNERDNSGCTPLHVACMHTAPRALAMLLAAGAKVNVKCNGSPILHLLAALWAVPRNAAFVEDAVAAVTGAGADTLATDDMARTWLHIVAAVGAEPLAPRIAECTRAAAAAAASAGLASAAAASAAGGLPELNAVDKRGYTPLHYAAAGRHGGMVAWLLAAGANGAATDAARGDTPAHLAARAGWSDGLATLEAATPAVAAMLNVYGVTPRGAFVPGLEFAGVVSAVTPAPCCCRTPHARSTAHARH